MSVVTVTAATDRGPPRPSRVARPDQEGHDDAADGAHVGDREVDLADQQDEDDADREGGDGRHLEQEVGEVPFREECVVQGTEHDRDDDEGDDDRQGAELATADTLPPSSCVAGERLVDGGTLEGFGHHRCPGGTLLGYHRAGVVLAHRASTAAASAIPGTCWSSPAVIGVDHILLRDGGSVVERHLLSETQHRDPVGAIEHVVEVVGDDDHPEVLFGQASYQVQHLPGLRHAEGCRGLVQDHELRVPHHRLGDGHGLPLPAGQTDHPLADRSERRDRQAREGLRRRLFHARLVQDETSTDPFSAEEHVADDVEVVRQGEVLIHDLDAEPRGFPGAVDPRGVPFEPDVSLVERVDPGDPLDQGGLAGPIVADERHDLPAPDLEVDAIQRLDGAEGLRESRAREERFTSHRRPASLSACDDRDASERVPVAAPPVQTLGQALSWHQVVSATSPVQISSTVRKPSAMTVSAMLSSVTGIGTRPKYGTTPSPSAESVG